MIAKQSIGKSFTEALNYNLNKMNLQDPKERAELLATNFTSMEMALIKKELAVMKALNPKLKRNTWHTSLNFAKGENISNDKMRSIAEEYMKRMGFDNNLHIIFRHHDSNHPHCHILALRNRFDGTVVSDGQNYQRSEKVIRALENKYQLIKVRSSTQSKNKAPNKDELEMIQRTGKVSNKLLLQEKVKDALNHSITMRQFINHLERNHVNVLFNQANTERVSGITFMIPGFKIRGQALGNQFKFGSITKEINYEQNRDGKTISQANSRTREKYNAGRKTIQSRSNNGREFNNEKGRNHARRSNKNSRYSEYALTGSGQESRTDINSDKLIRSNEKGSKENSMDLDYSISHNSNSSIGHRSNFCSIFDIPKITPASDDNTKTKKKRRISLSR